LVIDKALQPFREDKDCSQIVLVTNPDTIDYLAKNRATGKEMYCFGGETRSDSVFHGLMAVKEEIVLVHDGARCYLQSEDLNNLKLAMESEKAAILTKPIVDTVKVVSEGYIVRTIDRNILNGAQTPQAFYIDELMTCYKKARKDGFIPTDEAAVMEKYSNTRVKCVVSLNHNEKITTIDDIK
ncbi:MAG TPA: 2-C-methyl-D-erythritol 4-phosphate cytidylyltransferase, partial [Erysipelotrichaceae bacterium]|nr:2-C-methyl-D-erythritol 4-phosphate cytidylyltransferase [Erysipelotrichaceae bacterium]